MRCGLAVIGWENRAATEDDLRQMARLATEAMEQGCVGFATGLSYHPHVFCTLEELVAISKAVAAYGGVYNTHMRYHLGDQFLDPVHETLDVARQADIPVHIAHYSDFRHPHLGTQQPAAGAGGFSPRRRAWTLPTTRIAIPPVPPPACSCCRSGWALMGQKPC